MARILQLVQLTPVCAVNYNGLPEPISHLFVAALEEHVTVSTTQRIRHIHQSEESHYQSPYQLQHHQQQTNT